MVCTICQVHEAVGKLMSIMPSERFVAPDVIVIAEMCNDCSVKVISGEIKISSAPNAMTFHEIIEKVYNPEVEH